ncbi:hypothetical protein, partial [Sansalvadorimonas verongulae]|uniref:hypothetical protein n=1 Tax=Sansalvadorimonas verongulae TaxID=2172824 RepID=UPI001E33BD46
MVFRLNFVATSLCIAIGLSASASYASEDKSRSLHIIPVQRLDVISTGSIAIYSAGRTHIHPHKTTSCVIDRATDHHHVHCRVKQQKTGLTLTASTPAQNLIVETGATTWIRGRANMCHVSSGEHDRELQVRTGDDRPADFYAMDTLRVYTRD